jgi:hypothetical protein
MRLMIHELPNDPREREGTARTLRHCLTMEDGRIFYQDEHLTWAVGEDDYEWQTTRGPWHQLPTPEAADVVVSAVYDEGHACPVVFLRSGRVYHFVQRDGDVLPHFYENIDAVPGSPEDMKNR